MKRTEKIKQQVAKVKVHLRANKKTYLACTGTAVVAVVGTVMVANRRPELVALKQEIHQTMSWKPVANNLIEVHIEALGDPGNIIQDTTTGTVYASQGQAARELGLNKSVVSRHLSGDLPTAGGHVLTKLGKAPVAE